MSPDQITYAVSELEAILEVLAEEDEGVEAILALPKTMWAEEAEGRGC